MNSKWKKLPFQLYWRFLANKEFVFYEEFVYATRFLQTTRQIFVILLLPKTILPCLFTAAALTAFWTNDDQMGLIARTRTQMASEGLKVPADFEDFAEKEDLDALFKLLLKPAKTAGTTAGTLIEVESYAIPAKSQIRIDGARKMVLYYNLIGRRLEPADMMWPVIKNQELRRTVESFDGEEEGHCRCSSQAL